MAGTQRTAVSLFHRRIILRGAVSGAATVAVGAVLAACGSSATPAAPTTSAAATVAAPAAKPTTGATAVTTGNTSAPTTGTSAATSAPATVGATTGSTVVPGSATVANAASATGGMTAPATADGKIPSPNPDLGVPDAFTKLPAPFKSVDTPPGRGGKVTTLHISYVAPPTPHDQNKFWQELEKRLGVSSWDVTIAAASDYPQKFAAVIAGGDIPDLTFVAPINFPDQYKTILQGAFADLTPYLTGDALKEFPHLAKFPSILWKNVSLNKKIYGVPRPRFLANNADYFRQDWADKLGFSHPKNADEYMQMVVAMSKNDPDGNGKADTYGLSTSSPRPGWGIGGTNGTIGQMFRIPNGWRQNPDGTLTRFFETDEYKQALAYTRKLWEAGAFHPDSANLQTTQNKDLLYGGKIGGYNDGIAGLMGSTGARGMTKNFNPNANVTAYAPVGFDGGKPTYHKFIGYFGMTSISAKAGKDKERVKELLRILNYFAAPFGSEEWLFVNNGIEGVDYQMKNGVPIKTDQGKLEVIDALIGMANPPPVAFYDQPNDAQDMQKIQSDLLGNGINDPTWGYYSPTNGMKDAELSQLEADRRTEIIIGRQPLTAWDDFIKDWRSRGGDQIRKEYQDAIKGA